MKNATRLAIGIGAAVALCAACAADSLAGGSESCVILDKSGDPLSRLTGGVVFSSDIEGRGDCAFVEIDGDWNELVYLDALGGDFDIAFRLRSTFVDDPGHETMLPDQVAELALDLGMTYKLGGGVGLILRCMPGVYSDLEELDGDMFSAPYSFALVRSFDPRLSGIVGVEIRPEFDRELMPILGMVYEPDDYWRLELGIPRTRAMYFSGGALTAYAAFQWQNESFALQDEGGHRDRILTLEDMRAYLGLTCKVTEDLQLCGEFGAVFERSADFDNGGSTSLDIDNSKFVRLGILGPF